MKRGSCLGLTTAVSPAFPPVLSIPCGLDVTVPKLAAAVKA